ncbi:MAG: flagellar hook-basal body complex protein FliE [Actinomycetia bacterium]|nr:flagellar hook-basal body complex protein FliE [Actinomycetes bacterium]MCP4224147.1 flagellar hook-basal body complex protein FliE [Actinomycetes bacterium]MCP4961094.1 flagellar hook-basal body complex protein FliE [Actinomycetes bacterium]MCP5035290.1 flagellar hook-basal body complex protein FliE [Actinomycetes bacterium]
MVSPIRPTGIPAVSVTGLDSAPGSAAAKARQSDPSDESSFTKAVGDALTSVGQMDQAVANAAERAAVGDLESVSDYMIAATEAQLATEITVAVRDRAISAFNDIMRMQI